MSGEVRRLEEVNSDFKNLTFMVQTIARGSCVSLLKVRRS